VDEGAGLFHAYVSYLASQKTSLRAKLANSFLMTVRFATPPRPGAAPVNLVLRNSAVQSLEMLHIAILCRLCYTVQ